MVSQPDHLQLLWSPGVQVKGLSLAEYTQEVYRKQTHKVSNQQMLLLCIGDLHHEQTVILRALLAKHVLQLRD